MRNFKIGYLFILLIFFISASANSTGSPYKSYGFSKFSQKVLKIKSGSSTDTCDEKIVTVRKRKLRGVEVAGIQISETICAGIFTYRIFEPFYIGNVYASFRHCVSPKRGPPLV